VPVRANTGTPSHRACIQSSRERPANGARRVDVAYVSCKKINRSHYVIHLFITYGVHIKTY